MGPDNLLRPVFDKADRDYAAELFESVRKISTARLGVTRPSYSDVETAALQVIASAAQQSGLSTRYDAAANLVVELPGAPAQKPAYCMGSHLDSVPEGGNYDGLAGVIAGLMCLAKAKRLGVARIDDQAVVSAAGKGRQSHPERKDVIQLDLDIDDARQRRT